MSPHKKLVALGAIFALSLLVFGVVIPGEFIVDDKLWATGTKAQANEAVILQHIGGWVFRPLHTGLMDVSLKIFGANPGAWHVMSILLHALNGFLLYLVLEQLIPTLDWRLRIACVLLFLVHPAGSEAVFWISAMSELTVTGWVLFTLWLYLRWRQDWTLPRLILLGVSATIACLFKETAIVLPLLIFFYEIAQDRRLPFVRPLLILAVTALGFLIVRHLSLGSLAGSQTFHFSPGRVIEFALTHWRFLWWPAMPPFALRPPEMPLASPITLFFAFSVFLATLLTGVFQRAAKPLLALGLALLVLGLWPAYAVAIVGDGFFNGRQAYLPSTGLPLIVGAILVAVDQKRYKASLVALTLTTGWMTIATASGGIAWQSNIEIYRQSMAVSPAAAGPRAGIAIALAERGDIDTAIPMYASALERASTPRERADYLYHMASILGQNGRGNESDNLLRELTLLDPNHSPAWTGLGNNAWSAGRLEDAVAHYRRALQINPGNREAVSNLNALLTSMGGAR